MLSKHTLLLRTFATVFAIAACGAAAGAKEPPPLPEGIKPPTGAPQQEEQKEEKKEEPSLPPGLGAPPSAEPGQEPDAPPLPEGLFSQEPEEEKAAQVRTGDLREFAFLRNLTGFIESRAGFRLQNDMVQKDASIGEIRLQLENQWTAGPVVFRFKGDFLYDDVANDRSVDLEKGRGWFDLREANVTLRPLRFADIRAGRQILTWGVGDLLFINDLFPKDFRSFFIGRDDEYLKAPSDAVRVSLFHDMTNVEIVYTPRFDADRFIEGSRLSYFNPSLGRIAGQDAIIEPSRPAVWFDDNEIAVRVYRNIKTFEVAVYYYRGFWKNPEGQTSDRTIIFPRLSVWGASLRGPFQAGILSVEIGYYNSRDDPDGVFPLLPNSQFRYLIGYEREILPELTFSVQYYAERQSNFNVLRANLPPGVEADGRTRHLLTFRFTKLAMNQNLTVSLFNFWSPNEGDGHLRLRVSYKVTDAWRLEAGGNIFYGSQETFFGQFKNNTNIFIGSRLSF